MAPLVDNPMIASATLHNPLPLWLHTYIWPFAIIWPVFFRYYLSQDLYDQHIGGQEWTFVWCGTIITAQSLVWLSTHWNINLRSLFTSTSAKSVSTAKLIKVHPITNAGSADFCKIDRDNAGGKSNVSFLFQKRRFLYDAAKNSFAPLTYSIDQEPKPLLEAYQKSRGIDSASELSRIHQHYGDNTFDIPVPTFSELFKEHAVAPFFVFQIFLCWVMGC
ncbi:hypothetical protein BofuT4_P119910.1 [Botrytis cinerea T4]|uniref:P5A-ATPase transmembrane helical hairpin domain-containing protein n=1 Tax=Botryotinia fuckeliana (strain T4) TaxID=999810 RepID=G2XXU8_BOTF4|nr:hypothetical protein BofuT4_P119910.1 [Botrytis cinerea T4]